MFAGVERLEDGADQISVRGDAALDRLSRQELVVLQELGLGTSNAEIARRLCLPHPTVTRSVAHIIEKLGLPDRPAAVRLAREKGLRVL